MEPVEKLQLSDKVFSLLCPDMNDPVEEAPAENQIIIDEMKRYRGIKLNLNDRSCPLEFYNENRHILPKLNEIASIVFCTTASSVPSECTFSASGLLINKLRTRLSPVLAEELLFLKLH
jgi:hypothetical protein